ncbi:MAG: 16S rRNA (guanine(966)-N(2))-methyltransferase RsmD [Clostridia bacterium]|nr:16S rRNA (guanine(966)-N(2))-methyltransferase RsmD [Clostridia bacterium]
MRIISGRFRGLNLAPINCGGVRPTADRVKESLFNILSAEVSGARVLDLFCGSGNLGIESLSRGASFVHFNDLSKDSLAVLKKNLSRIKCQNYAVTNLDYSACLSRAGVFDIIFLDPPYKEEYGIDALKIIAEGNILNDGGIAVYERDKSFSGEVDGLEMYDERKYGRTYLSFFKGKHNA